MREGRQRPIAAAIAERGHVRFDFMAARRALEGAVDRLVSEPGRCQPLSFARRRSFSFFRAVTRAASSARVGFFKG